MVSKPQLCTLDRESVEMADSQVASGAASLNFGMESFYSNWVRTMHDEQLLGCDVVFPSDVGADVDRKSTQTDSSTGPPSRPPFYSCEGGLAPTGNATGATSDVVPHGGWPGGFPADPNWGMAVVVASR